MPGHVPEEFPTECVQQLLAALRVGDVIHAVPCAFIILAWGWNQAIRGFEAGPSVAAGTEAYAALVELNAALDGGFSDTEHATLDGPVMDLLVRQTLQALLKWVQDQGGIQWIIDQILSR